MAEGTFVFKRTPFGMMNSGATFSRMMRKLLEGLDHVTNYIDDICVYTDTWEEHLEVLGKIFQRLKDANLHVRPSKCMFGATSVDFLGHHVFVFFNKYLILVLRHPTSGANMKIL